jgi:hypothetical protein
MRLSKKEIKRLLEWERFVPYHISTITLDKQIRDKFRNKNKNILVKMILRRNIKIKRTSVYICTLPNNWLGTFILNIVKKFTPVRIKGRKPIKGHKYAWGGSLKLKHAGAYDVYTRSNW